MKGATAIAAVATMFCAFVTLPISAAQTCPLPKEILGASLTDAKSEMTRALGQQWFVNLVGCGNEYTNLISEEPSAECVAPGLGRPARVLIFRLEGSRAVLGLSYILTQRIDEREAKALLSSNELKEIQKIPAPLSSILRDRPQQSLFVSENENRLLRISPEEGDQNRMAIEFYDLAAFKRNLDGLLSCTR